MQVFCRILQIFATVKGATNLTQTHAEFMRKSVKFVKNSSRTVKKSLNHQKNERNLMRNHANLKKLVRNHPQKLPDRKMSENLNQSSADLGAQGRLKSSKNLKRKISKIVCLSDRVSEVFFHQFGAKNDAKIIKNS